MVWRMKKLLLLAMAVVLVGCSGLPKYDDTARDFSNIRIGMSRDEVMAAKGIPFETAATSGVEFLLYAVGTDYGNAGFVPDEKYEKYYVRLVDGKVHSFGSVGDFDSTKDPTLRIIKQRK